MRTYYPKYLEKEIYKRVLSIARSYYQDLNKIKQIENDYIYTTSRPDGAGGRNSYISDPTFNIANQIEKHTKLLRNRTEAVSMVLAMFSEEEQDTIKQNIMQGVPMIYCDTNKSERSVQKIRHDFLITLAIKLGELPEFVIHT